MGGVQCPTYWVSVTTYVWSVPLAFWKATGDELTQAAGSFSVSSSANASLGGLLAAARFFGSFSLRVQEGLLGGFKLVLLQQLSKAYITVIAVQHPSQPPRDKQGVLLTKDYLKLLLSSSGCVSKQGLCSGAVVRGLPSSGESKIHTHHTTAYESEEPLANFIYLIKLQDPSSHWEEDASTFHLYNAHVWSSNTILPSIAKHHFPPWVTI